MTQQELQKKYDYLFDKIRRMRGVQKDYFKYRAKSDLEILKKIERDVDLFIEKEIKEINSKQTEIF